MFMHLSFTIIYIINSNSKKLQGAEAAGVTAGSGSVNHTGYTKPVSRGSTKPQGKVCYHCGNNLKDHLVTTCPFLDEL